MSAGHSQGGEGGRASGLGTWSAGDPLPERLYARVRDHPNFSEAVRTLATNMLDLAAADRAMDGIFKDAGRYLAALCAASLHDRGITLPRLKELCAGFGMLSAGRVRALLIYLRYLGYVGLWSERSAHGPARYSTSPVFLAAWRAQLRGALGGASLIEPAAAEVAARLDEPAFFAVFCRVQLDGLMASARLADRDAPFVRIFMQRHAGNQIAWALILDGEDGRCPPEGALRVSFAALSRRFGVSSMHVKRLFADAAREGLMEPHLAGTTRFTEAGLEQIGFVYAAQLVQLLVACARASTAAERLPEHF